MIRYTGRCTYKGDIMQTPFRAWLDIKGLTVAHFAKETGIDYTTASKWSFEA